MGGKPYPTFCYAQTMGFWALIPRILVWRHRPEGHNLNHRRCENFKSHNPASERIWKKKKKEWRLKFTIFLVERSVGASSITLSIVSVGTPPFVGRAQVVRVNLICFAWHTVTTCRLSSHPQPSSYCILIMYFISHTNCVTALLHNHSLLIRVTACSAVCFPLALGSSPVFRKSAARKMFINLHLRHLRLRHRLK
jgi:hypothetical protein